MAAVISKIPRWSTLLCALVLLSATLAACGGGDDDSSSSSGSGSEQTQTTEPAGGGAAATALTVDAVESGGLSFSRRDLAARAGDVTLTLDNPDGNQLPHAIEVEGNGVEEETDTIEPGRTASVTVGLRPGRYTFYCPVGNHRQEGMEGTLVVR